MENLYKAYGDKFEFFLVYIREAHPNLLKKVPEGKGPRSSPKELSERAALASKCVAELKLSLPVLLDDMDGPGEKAYHGWPDRIVIIDAQGKIAYPGRRGPGGFSVAEAEGAIKRLIAAGLPDTRPASPAAQPAQAAEPAEPARPTTEPATRKPTAPSP